MGPAAQSQPGSDGGTAACPHLLLDMSTATATLVRHCCQAAADMATGLQLLDSTADAKQLSRTRADPSHESAEPAGLSDPRPAVQCRAASCQQACAPQDSATSVHEPDTPCTAAQPSFHVKASSVLQELLQAQQACAAWPACSHLPTAACGADRLRRLHTESCSPSTLTWTQKQAAGIQQLGKALAAGACSIAAAAQRRMAMCIDLQSSLRDVQLKNQGLIEPAESAEADLLWSSAQVSPIKQAL